MGQNQTKNNKCRWGWKESVALGHSCCVWILTGKAILGQHIEVLPNTRKRGLRGSLVGRSACCQGQWPEFNPQVSQYGRREWTPCCSLTSTPVLCVCASFCINNCHKNTQKPRNRIVPEIPLPIYAQKMEASMAISNRLIWSFLRPHQKAYSCVSGIYAKLCGCSLRIFVYLFV